MEIDYKIVASFVAWHLSSVLDCIDEIIWNCHHNDGEQAARDVMGEVNESISFVEMYLPDEKFNRITEAQFREWTTETEIVEL